MYGFGEKKTPKPFVAACDKFIYTEILRRPSGGDRPDPAAQGPLRPCSRPPSATAPRTTAGRPWGWWAPCC